MDRLKLKIRKKPYFNVLWNWKKQAKDIPIRNANILKKIKCPLPVGFLGKRKGESRLDCLISLKETPFSGHGHDGEFNDGNIDGWRVPSEFLSFQVQKKMKLRKVVVSAPKLEEIFS